MVFECDVLSNNVLLHGSVISNKYFAAYINRVTILLQLENTVRLNILRQHFKKILIQKRSNKFKIIYN